MVQSDLFRQEIWENWRNLSFDDVEAFAGPAPAGWSEDEYARELLRRYGAGDFLPDYMGRVTGETGFSYRLPSTTPEAISEHDAQVSALCRSRAESEDTRRLAEVATARRLLRLGLRLFSAVQGDEPVTCDTLASLGVNARSGARGTIGGLLAMTLSPSDYLAYVEDGMERSVNTHGGVGVTLIPSDADKASDSFQRFRWVAATGDATLHVLIGRVPDDERGYRLLLARLLDALLDIHLNHASQLHHDGGRLSFVSSDVVTALWVRMREEATGGRVGFCKVCGRPFVAVKERKERRLYCGRACQVAYGRAVRVLGLIESGKTAEEAKNDVKGISLRRVREIAARNNLLKDGFDYGL